MRHWNIYSLNGIPAIAAGDACQCLPRVPHDVCDRSAL